MKPIGTVAFVALAAWGATPVLTRSYDNGRTGANTSENTLTSANIATRQLKRVNTLDIPDDPRIEAQPLYVPGIGMNDGKAHNVLFVCSMGNTVYAFDADAPQGQGSIWKVSLGKPYAPALDPRHPPRGRMGDMFGINILWGVL